MDYNHITQLLEKYFEGETSLKEESRIKSTFFQSNNVPEQLKRYQNLFQFFRG